MGAAGTTSDVVVVGNGIVGSATALALLDRDPSLRIAVVGDPRRRGAASAAAGAMHGDLGEVTRAARASTFGRAKLALAAEATRRWPAFRARLAEAHPRDLSRASGTFVVQTARAGALEAANFDAIVAEAEARDARCEFVSPSSHRVPAGAPPFTRALFLPDEGAIDAPGLLAALDAALDATGRCARVAAQATVVLEASAHVRGVRLADGRELTAPRVLLAAGAGTQSLLAGLPEIARAIPRVLAGVGVSLVVSSAAPLPHVLRTPNGALATGLHAVPRGAGLVYVGATNEVALEPTDVAAPEIARALLHAVIDELLPALAGARVVGERVGNRPVTTDGYPLLGATSLGGLFVATGTYRDGLHLAPLLGADLAARLLGGPPMVDHPFPPERAPLRTLHRDDAISEGVEHLVWRAGRGLGEAELATLRATTRARVEAIYARLGGERVVPADLLPLLERAPEAIAALVARDELG